MVTSQALASEFETAQRLVHLLESDGFALEAAIFVLNEEGAARLYLVPVEMNDSDLRQTIQITHTMSQHRDELPGRHDLQFSLVKRDNPIVQAVISAQPRGGRVRGIYKDGTFVDEAYILRPAA